MIRALRLALVQLRINLAQATAYRADFVLQSVMSLASAALTLLPLLVLFGERPTVAKDWDEPSALIVVAYFVAVRAILEGLVTPALVDLVDKIRTGAFDYVLLKPADAQLLASTSRQDVWCIFDFAIAIAIAVYAFYQLGHGPSVADVALGVALLATGVTAMYAVFVVCAAASFWVVRLDNLVWLIDAVFDAARWPIQVFRGAWRFVFTFVLPMAIMTTYPAMALLGRLDAQTALATVGGTAIMIAISRLVWKTAIRSYTSASS